MICQPPDFKFISQAGERKPDNLWPVIIGCREHYLKEKILANAHRLRTNPEMREVRIVPDLTKRQREEDAKVGREVDKHNKEAEVVLMMAIISSFARAVNHSIKEPCRYALKAGG